MTTPRPIFVLRLRPLPGVNGILALRALLKRLLRDAGLICVGVTEEQPPAAAPRPAPRRSEPR